MNPPALLVSGFLFVIILGSFLLFLPISSSKGEFGNYLDCLFTATSAVCVTGLSTVNITEYFNDFGKAIILFLIQIGGLGFMTMATLVALVLGKRITLRDRLVIQEQMGESKLSGMVKLIRYVIISTFFIEFVGAVLLSFYFVPKYKLRGIFHAIFHSISAFCNAGFDILGDNSLVSFEHSLFPLFIISFLIILGGLGFNVYMDINAKRFEFKKYSLHTKIVLVVTSFLLVVGTVVFFILEFTNSNTFKNMTLMEKFTNSFFQSVTTRTAGFYTVSQANLTEGSVAFSLFLMFIGGSPASTAGGIKTITFFLLIINTISFIKGNTDIVVFKKRIDISFVTRAVGILVISLFLVGLSTFVLILLEPDFRFLDLLFEVVSAFATVGLTRDITPLLHSSSKILIIFLMFIGRVGSMTIIFALYNKVKKQKFKYANGKVIVG